MSAIINYMVNGGVGHFFGGLVALFIVCLFGIAFVKVVLEGLSKVIHGEQKIVNNYVNTKEVDKRIKELKEKEKELMDGKK